MCTCKRNPVQKARCARVGFCEPPEGTSPHDARKLNGRGGLLPRPSTTQPPSLARVFRAWECENVCLLGPEYKGDEDDEDAAANHSWQARQVSALAAPRQCHAHTCPARCTLSWRATHKLAGKAGMRMHTGAAIQNTRSNPKHARTRHTTRWWERYGERKREKREGERVEEGARGKEKRRRGDEMERRTSLAQASHAHARAHTHARTHTHTRIVECQKGAVCARRLHVPNDDGGDRQPRNVVIPAA